MKKLFIFNCDCRYGSLYGLFKATQEEVDNIIGKYVYFGEVLGKYSEIEGHISKDDIELFSDDPTVVEKAKEFGYNPLEFYNETHYDDDNLSDEQYEQKYGEPRVKV